MGKLRCRASVAYLDHHLAKPTEQPECGKRQDTSPSWPGSGENAKLLVLLGQVVRNTPGYGLALAKQ
ncbi:hypothetical protein Y032_0011g1491 [Ancylostoma ceylanicum]|uniref:Uncharacterized protein n=1 Tax=Ancylostoma ceylanicum TaxID=53326 RepID=A0A016VGV5_9BILA|nr:hypothetical protein Y032_0011g1491 [Ancylostoma ceylanicum]